MRAHLSLAALALLSAPTLAQQTIRVEVDYMAVSGGHSHRPEQEEMDAVIRMFAAHGITLVIEIDDNIGHTGLVACNAPGNENFWNCTSPTSFSTVTNGFRDHGAGWHYAVFIHRYDDGAGIGSSGKSNGFNTFVVSLGGGANQIGTPFDRAATFAHELGHDLGLGHQSPATPALGSGPYAPNLASIMSYQYQLRGVKDQLECLGLVGDDHLFKNLDYSNGRLPPLKELFLSEQIGAGVHPVDWDCSGTIESGTTTRDLDEDDQDPNWCNTAGGIGIVHDYDEWSNIVDSADDPGLLDGTRVVQDYNCISFDEIRAMEDGPGDCYSGNQPDPTVVEPNAPGKMIWIDPANLGSQIGTGEFPYAYLDWGVLFAPDDSILYIQPGLHGSSNGNPILLDKPMVLTGPGSAVIDP